MPNTKFESYEWIRLPDNLPRENLVMVIAKTPKTTVHPEDEEYPIRIFKPEELQEAARSLAQRPVGINHMSLIEGAFVVDANWNDKEQCIEALLFIPNYFMKKIKEGIINKVSVEYNWREEEKTKEGVVFKGFVFNRVDLLERLNAGDSNTEIRPVLMEGRRALMEGIVKVEDTGETDIKQGVIQASVDEPSLTFFKEIEGEAGEFLKRLGEPFAGYKDFADCVAKNRDKSDPQAYCGYIKHKVEDPKKESNPCEACEDRPEICDKLIEDIPEPELEEAAKVKGYKPPEGGTLPAHGKSILANAYASCRKSNPDYPKERCSKIAWGAVKNAGYVQKDDKWVKEEALEEGSVIAKIPEVNIREANLTGKQIPEKPVNPMAAEPTPMSAIFAPIPKPLDPEQKITAIGAIGDDKGPIVFEGDKLDKSVPVGGEPILNIIKDLTGAKQAVESSPEPKKEEPKKEEVKKEEVKTEPVKEPEKKEEKPKEEPKKEETKTEPPKTEEKKVEVPKIDARDVKITELEESIKKLQENAKKTEEQIDKAKKEAKKEVIDKIEKVIPKEDIIQRFNMGGRILADDVRKEIYKIKKECEK